MASFWFTTLSSANKIRKPQTFASDTDYILDATLDYANGLPTNQIDRALRPSSTHFSSNTSLPLANFVLCKAENAVYEGFELANDRGLTYTGGSAPATPAGWTGNKAMQLDNTFTLVTPMSVTKFENSYRISVWAFSSSATNVVVKAKSGTTVQAILTLNNTQLNKWNYLEAYMDMTSVASSFTFEVSSTGTVLLDDFIALPKSARVNSKTYLPLTGVTSQTDDRGNSNVVAYDVMGRKFKTFDRNRNLVELQEYGLARQAKVSLNAKFTVNVTEYIQGQPVIFTAAPSCASQVTYEWKFTNSSGLESTVSGASPTTTKTFTLFGSYSVQLTVSSQGYQTVTLIDNICVSPSANFNVALAVTPLGPSTLCAYLDDGKRTFTTTITGGSLTGWNIVYTWYFTDRSGNWENSSNYPFNGDVESVSGNVLVFKAVNYTYQIKCDVTVEKAGGNGSCYYQQSIGLSAIAGVTYINDSPCR